MGVLTSNEQKELALLKSQEKANKEDTILNADENLMIRFSFKEAIYKAIYPIVQRFVSFQEAEVRPHPDGSISTTMILDKKVRNTNNPTREENAKLTKPKVGKGWRIILRKAL